MLNRSSSTRTTLSLQPVFHRLVDRHHFPPNIPAFVVKEKGEVPLALYYITCRGVMELGEGIFGGKRGGEGRGLSFAGRVGISIVV